MNPAISIIDGTIRRLEQGWTKGNYAEDEDGRPVSFRDPLARRWCLVGALLDARNEVSFAAGVYEMLEEVVGDHRLSHWNDVQVSVEPVLAACREARRILAAQDTT